MGLFGCLAVNGGVLANPWVSSTFYSTINLGGKLKVRMGELHITWLKRIVVVLNPLVPIYNFSAH